MKYLKRFDFLLESLILEKAVVCSDELIKVLKTMESPLAKTMLKAHEEASDVVDNSYIDFDKEDGLVSYLPANREINRDNGQEVDDKWNVRGRQKISIGKLVKAMSIKLGINYPEAEVEKFVNEYKSKQKPTRFILVKDEASIKKYYYEVNYDRASMVGDPSLINSCMRGATAQDYFSIYYNENTPCKLLVLLNNENNKVMGRAIVWNNVIDNNGKTFTFMDRVYTIDSALEESFKAYAKETGWWYKDSQSNQRYTITDGKESESLPFIKVPVPNLDWNRTQMPYMDTFAYLGYEHIDGQMKPFLYNEVYKERGGVYNWHFKFRSQGGHLEENYYSKKKDAFGNRILNNNAKVLKEYGDEYVWMIDGDNDDLLNPNDFETVYILFDKKTNGIGDPIIALGIDTHIHYPDAGLCVVETAVRGDMYRDYVSFSSEIADIIKQQNHLIKYTDWDYEGNFKIPGHIKDPEVLNTILYHTDGQWIEHGIALYNAFNKKCAEVILKYKPDILKNNNISNLISLMKFGLVEKNSIEDRIKMCGVSDLIYKNDFLWIKFKEYAELTFMFDNNDSVSRHGRTSSRKYAEGVLNGEWDYGYIENSLNDIDFSIINEKNKESILTLMENEIDIIKSWFNEKEIPWNDNWKDVFRNNVSGKIIWRAIKDNYTNIGNAIKYAMDSAQESADYGHAWDKITHELSELTEFEDGAEPRFQFKYDWLIAINDNDDKILNAVKRYYENWDDFNIGLPSFATVSIPYQGWQGNVSNEQYNEELEHRLDEI